MQAENGEEAVKLACSKEFDLILMYPRYFPCNARTKLMSLAGT
jgi:hypothetical protein